ncbi:MAG: alpha/beta fold hydrolase [Hyphomicrobiales bacterium]|nr:alpha/beta fold hydrolase [Hyphomicrobiales bacterium]
MGIYASVENWDDAYANREHINDAQKVIDSWEILAPEFRQDWAEGAGSLQTGVSYGDSQREKFDVFYPAGSAKGLFVFVHGGYWVAFDKSSWSHLARGALDQGWAVALPSYILCPDARISEITNQIGAAIEAAAGLIEGPIVLAGHSAGGHLVSRMGCVNAPLSSAVSSRIRRIVSISGLHDLRPLLRLELNNSLKLDKVEAAAESPALLLPFEGIAIDCVVGGDERPEFIRQNALLANIWVGLGARTREIVVAGRHHFNIIEELHDYQHGWLHDALNGN